MKNSIFQKQNYDANAAEKTQEYSVVLGAIEDVLQDVNQINLDSDAAKRWMAEHIVWKIWKNNKDVPVQS